MIHLDESRRAEAIEAGWLAYSERVKGMEGAYRAACQSWQVVAVCDGPKVIGALFVRNGVIHLGIIPEYRSKWASKRVIREMLAYGKNTTVLDNEPDCIEFVSRIGFRKEGHRYEFHV